MTTALLVIDMINDFVTGKFENERAKEIIPNINRLSESARSSDIPLIFICDTHEKGDPEFSVWDRHAVAGTEGSEIVPELEVKDKDYKLEKSKYSAFFDTELDSLLKELGVDKLVLTGVLTHICIQHTAADAFYRGYEVIIPEDAVEDVSDDLHDDSIDFMKENYNAKLKDCEELIELW